jgi:hypothetical protein
VSSGGNGDGEFDRNRALTNLLRWHLTQIFIAWRRWSGFPRDYGPKTARGFIFVVLGAFRLVVATAVCFSEAASAASGVSAVPDTVYGALNWSG